MTHEEHRAWHEVLHHNLDMLLKDYLRHHPGTTIGQIEMWEFVEWSHRQTREPEEPSGELAEAAGK